MEEDGGLRFVADVHLGRLARWMRLFGVDTAYHNSWKKKDLIEIATKEDRVLLSRDRSFSSLGALCFFHIESEEPFSQLTAVFRFFRLQADRRLFTRCMLCNGLLHSVKKESIVPQLPAKTALYYEEFWRCDNCNKLYWQGPHYLRMLARVENLKKEL